MEGHLNTTHIDYVLYHLRLQFNVDKAIAGRFRFVDSDQLSSVEEGCIIFPLSPRVINFNAMVRIEEVPVLFSLSESSDIFTWQGGSLIFNHDFLKSAFYLLSGYQEFTSSRKDHFGRFPYDESIHKYLDICDKPLVNYYFNFIGQGVEAFCKEYGIDFRRNKIFGDLGFMLSHDVDILDTYTLRGALFRIKRLIIRKVSRNSFREDVYFFLKYFFRYINFFKRINPHWDFEYLIGEAEKRGFTSVFYFLHKDLKGQDSSYEFDETRLKDLFRLLTEHECEVGLHGSTRSAADLSLMEEHRRRLMVHSGSSVSGVRQHRLIHYNIRTTRIQEEAGFRYDATMGFAEREGFRHSCCFPFRLYDFEKEAMTDIWHIPLVVMDATLYMYRRLDKEAALASVVNLIEECKKFNGLFTLLWHNGNFDEEDYPTGKEVFESILDEIESRNAVSLTGKQCIDQLDKFFGYANTDGA